MIQNNIEDKLIVLIRDAVCEFSSHKACVSSKEACLEIPKESSHGDLSSNAALKLSREFKKNPRLIAESLKTTILKKIETSELNGLIEKIQIAGPGFINFFINNEYFYKQLENILQADSNFGVLDIGKDEKMQIEFVSANPTGPLSVAHARQAAIGDSLARILEFIGFKVSREYYLNDKGNQIEILGRSIELRLKELEGKKDEFPENYYQGDYIKDIAKDAQNKKIKADKLKDYGVKYILDGIKKDLVDFGVNFDVWFSQAKLEESGKTEKVIDFLRKKGFIYEQDGAVWFKSTQFGDDKDRVIIKSDKSFTYLAPDIAYHKDKFERGFRRLINIWGPDHHGYIPRIKAAVSALGKQEEALSVIIAQLVTLYRDGQPVKMSTRAGSYVTLREIIDEVGKDAARFFLLNRRASSHLDFDLELAKKESNENPVYYIQYAFARISSIKRKKEDVTIIGKSDLGLLTAPEELSLMRKLTQFPHILKMCFNVLDSYPLLPYLSELAAEFHKFYDKHKVLDVGSPSLTNARISLVTACAIVLRNGLSLLGISSPDKM